jgi:hypothetical protein
MKCPQACQGGDLVKSSINKRNSGSEMVPDNVFGNEVFFVVGDSSMVLTAAHRYPRPPGGVFDSVLSSGIKALGRNARDLSDCSVGDWAPLRENASKAMFDDITVSLVIPVRMPTEDSFKGPGFRADSNVS